VSTPNEKAEQLATELITGLDELIAMTNRTGLPFGAHGEMWFTLTEAQDTIRNVRTMARAREWSEEVITTA
jgi:hypothetical protein